MRDRAILIKDIHFLTKIIHIVGLIADRKKVSGGFYRLAICGFSFFHDPRFYFTNVWQIDCFRLVENSNLQMDHLSILLAFKHELIAWLQNEKRIHASGFEPAILQANSGSSFCAITPMEGKAKTDIIRIRDNE